MARIIIADDNEMILYVLHEIITGAGHVVVASSTNGTDALKNYFDFAPDLLILDHIMPNMVGLDVARHILDKQASAKIILCTGNFEEMDDWSKKMGFTLIAKPFDSEKIIQSIDFLLRE